MESTPQERKSVAVLMEEFSRSTTKEFFVPQKIKDDFLSECQIWSTLRHPCVVQFLGVYYPAMNQYSLPVMVMEKMQQSLRNLMDKYSNIPLNVKLSILDEVYLGLRYLHSRNPPIVHRYLTPNNILLSNYLEAKITDLGVAKVMQTTDAKTMTKAPGTTDFMPPESLADRPVYGVQLDIFSYDGVILYTITQLWPQPSSWIQFDPDTGKSIYLSELQRRQCYLDKINGDAADLKPLVTSCLDNNPKNRPPVVQVSMTIKKAKDVCSQKSSRDGMSPIEWWIEASSEKKSQVTRLTTALEEMVKENNSLKADNTHLRTNNDKMKNEIVQLTTLLNKVAVNNENQMQQIDFQSNEIYTIRDEIEQLRTEVDMIKARNIQLKVENDNLRGYEQQQVLKKPTIRLPVDLFSKPVNIKWEEGAPAPVSRANHTAVWLNGLLYVAGGVGANSYTLDSYNPVSNSWSSPINTPYCYFGMTTLNNKLVIAGGLDKSFKITNQLLTTGAGQLKNYTKMTTARSFATATGHQGILIITGGRDDKGNRLSSTELFDSANGQWYTCSDLPNPCSSLKSVIFDNIIYLLGGVDTEGCYSPAVFTARLNTLSRHQLLWSTQRETPLCQSAPVSINDTNLLIVGGCKDDIFTSDICNLNKVTHRWEAIGQIPSARGLSSAVSTADNRIIVMGGVNDKGEFTNTVWIGSCELQ